MKGLVAALILTMAAAGSVAAQPKIVVAEGLKPDFGEIFSSAVIKRSLTLLNKGKDTLQISAVSASCGCTSVSSTDRIAPGDTGRLNITFNPHGANGKVTKGVSFDTNDPLNKHIHVNFMVEIVKVVDVDPDYLTFPSAQIDSPSTSEVTLKNIGTDSIHIFRILSTSENLKGVSNKMAIAPDDEATVTCTFTPKEHGVFRGNLSIKIDSRKLPVIDVRVFGFAKAANK